jgi:hypothetical protein
VKRRRTSDATQSDGGVDVDGSQVAKRVTRSTPKKPAPRVAAVVDDSDQVAPALQSVAASTPEKAAVVVAPSSSARKRRPAIVDALPVADSLFVVTACDGVSASLLAALTASHGMRFTSDATSGVTHIVTEVGLQRRTEKVLLALATCTVRAIVTPAFLKAAHRTGAAVLESDHALVDSVTERRIGSLAEALERGAELRARNVRVLENLHFWVTPKLAATIPICQRVIETANGVFHGGSPSARVSGRIDILLVDTDEHHTWDQTANDFRVGIYSWLFVTDSIMSAQVDFGKNWLGGVRLDQNLSFSKSFLSHWVGL